MSAGRHAAGDGSFARSAGGAMTRGIILIIVAVVIGIVLIRTAVDGDTVSAGTITTSTTAAPTTDPPTDTTTPAATTTPSDTTVPDTTVPGDTTPTTAAPTDTTAGGGSDPDGTFVARDASEVRVQVVNTTSVSGAAGRKTEVFTGLGYIVLKATNSTAGTLAVTKIHHASGYLLEAQKVADELGLDRNDNVFPMPDAPEADIVDYDNPHVLVLVGTDIAS